MKRIYIILIVFVALITLTSCSLNSSSGLIYSEDLINLNIGESTLLAISGKEEAEWSTSDSEVATVDEFGLVTGISGGIAKITAKVGDKEYTILVSVSVNDPVKPTMEISGKQTIYVGQGVRLTAKFTNTKVTPTVEWTSSDEEIATIDSEGVVTGVKCGIVTIKATAVLDELITKEFMMLVRDYSSILMDTVNNNIELRRVIIDGDIDLTSLSNVTTEVIAKNYAATIGVSNYQYVNVSGTEKSLERAGIGTGIIFRRDSESSIYKYYVITNYHVIKDNEKLKVYLGDRDLEIDASAIATDPDLDIAILTFRYNDKIEVCKLGDSSKTSVGEFVIALGNAEGYDYYGSATFGMVSYVNRKLRGESALYIQHDAAINPGNSGGPLFNMKGEVIGINTIKLADTDIDNMGFSITINIVKEFLDRSNISYPN